MAGLNNYEYIRAWGRMMGSYSYYITEQVERAKNDNAPSNSVYFGYSENRWITFDEIHEDTKRTIQGIIDSTTKLYR